MLGIRYVKFQPHLHVFAYRRGRIVREGRGLSFYYYAPATSLVAVPVSSQEAPFIFAVSTSDYQTLTVQGQASYRVRDPRRMAEMLNFTLDTGGQTYVSDDPAKLGQRIINIINVLTNKEMGALDLKRAIAFQEALTSNLMARLSESPELEALGVEVLGMAVLAIKPNPDTARALEAQTREAVLKQGDDAIYSRRNSALEQERKIKENELNTEIAIEVKKREIRETQLDAERMVQDKQQVLADDAKDFQIRLEKKEQALAGLEAVSRKTRAEAKAHELAAVLGALRDSPAEVLQVLAASGMSSERLIAQAFQGIAERAEKIGTLNISPELLTQIMQAKA